MSNFGLTDEHLQTVKQIVSRYPQVEQVVIFGSRAMGNYQPASDIDLALKGKAIDSTVIAEIPRELEEETTIPSFFDVLNYDSIGNQKLQAHIDRVGITVYMKSG